MQREQANIAVIFDDAEARDAVAAALSGYFTYLEIPLDRYLADGAADAALHVLCVNFGTEKSSSAIRRAMNICQGEPLFVLPTDGNQTGTQIRHDPNSKYFILPLDADKFRATVKASFNGSVEKKWALLEPMKRNALKSAVVSFEKCFDQVANGEPIPLEDLESSCKDIRLAAEQGGLDSWISALDDHHDYSFRHSMFVCGSLTYFAHALGIKDAELDLLALGGLLHDIGKCRIPVGILDKPGKLDDREWEIMKSHPLCSKEILLAENELDSDLIAMAVSHHERLDGTGYPEGLSGTKINDHVRLTAIADVYSALIDKRSYKGAMSSEAALEAMTTFEHQLDLDLVREFRAFTLDKG